MSIAECSPGEWVAVPPVRKGNHWQVAANFDGRLWTIARIDNGAPGDTLETEAANAHLFEAAKDHALLAAALVSGKARWEPFAGAPRTGEVCISGLCHCTELDQFGVPILTGLLRAEILKQLAEETRS